LVFGYWLLVIGFWFLVFAINTHKPLFFNPIQPYSTLFNLIQPFSTFIKKTLRTLRILCGLCVKKETASAEKSAQIIKNQRHLRSILFCHQ